MRFLTLAALALLAPGAPAPVAAQEADIVVRGDVARNEIERILDADNLDTSRLSAREVAEAIGRIRRGRAPEDFWAAYQAHVAAWGRLAQATEIAAQRQADSEIEASFDEVERIARAYGAILPTPPWQEIPTV
jgi:hypothetical protein